MSNLCSYSEDYYERGIELGISGYTNYRWIPELTIPLCASLCELLKIFDDDKILDFGCAKGYMVKAFRLLHKQCWGVDISDYALKCAPSDVSKYLYNNLDFVGEFDWIIAKDVLEHVEYDQIDELISKLASKTENMLCIVPLGAGKKYVIPSHDLDITHIIKQPMLWWENKFIENGFDFCEASYKMKYVKENYAKWEKGFGFFILHKGD